MADVYSKFENLKAREIEGKDYEIKLHQRDSSVAIIAPHGGGIETHTTQIAAEIAGDTFSFYSFVGLKREDNSDLHITSANFNEPTCLALISRCDIVVAIHGRNDKTAIDGQEKIDRETILLGGLDKRLQGTIADTLNKAHFVTRIGGHRFPALQTTNVCNRGRSGRGVQLELARMFRQNLYEDRNRLTAFVGAVRAAVANCR